MHINGFANMSPQRRQVPFAKEISDREKPMASLRVKSSQDKGEVSRRSHLNDFIPFILGF